MRINETIYIVHLAQYLAHHKLSKKKKAIIIVFVVNTYSSLKTDEATLRDNEFLRNETKICRAIIYLRYCTTRLYHRIIGSCLTLKVNMSLF